MQVNVKSLKEKLYETRENIINDAILDIDQLFDDEKEKYLVDELFKYVSETSDLEEYIWETVDSFCNNNISAEEVFALRKNGEISFIISEILSERDCTLEDSSVSAIDEILDVAGFRYMLRVSSRLEKELLQVYILEDVSSILADFDNNLELEVNNENYDGYEGDEDSLLDDFIDELILSIHGNEKIIQIEDVAKTTLMEFFKLGD